MTEGKLTNVQSLLVKISELITGSLLQLKSKVNKKFKPPHFSKINLGI